MQFRPLLCANMKMHALSRVQQEQMSVYQSNAAVDIVVFPSALDIHHWHQQGIAIGGQHGMSMNAGPFTGDISMSMLKKAGCSHVLCGHSERRHHHHETDASVCEQVIAALENDLTPILCIGETKEERRGGHMISVLTAQLKRVSAISIPVHTSLIVAYEPVWSIGTGVLPTEHECEEAIVCIHSLLPNVRVLYGGSVNAACAASMMRIRGISGLLIGGASLDPAEWLHIRESIGV